MNLNPNIYPAIGPQQSGGSTQIPSLTGYEPKSVEFKDIDTEAISLKTSSPEELSSTETLEQVRIKSMKDL